MSVRLSVFWNFLSRNKYLITIVVGLAIVGFIDENSFMQRLQYEFQIGQLKDEIEKYEQQNDKSARALEELKRDPRAIEKIARERYFMKTDDEDIFVLSTDQQAEEEAQEKANNINEAVE